MTDQERAIVIKAIEDAALLCGPDEKFVGITVRDGKIRTVVLYKNFVGEKG